jgi:hypothetical protein
MLKILSFYHFNDLSRQYDDEVVYQQSTCVGFSFEMIQGLTAKTLSVYQMCVTKGSFMSSFQHQEHFNCHFPYLKPLVPLINDNR